MTDTKISRVRKLKALKDLRPIDDSFMRVLFRDNMNLAQDVLRIILKKDDLKIEDVKTQADMKQVAGARSINLDVYAKDDNGVLYNIEIQRSNPGADIHRARYHSSVMDVENLDPRHEFDKLPETYVIFITENDTFGDGEPIHLIRRVDLTTGKEAGDGTNILYLNGKYQEKCKDDEKDALGWLMHDFKCANPDEMHYDWLANKSKELKESPEGVESMCKIMDEFKQEGIQEGMQLGMQRTLEIIKAMQNGVSEEELIEKGYSREEILQVFDLWNTNQQNSR